MFKYTISVDIGNKYIKIIVGNPKQVSICDNIVTPAGAVIDNKITDIGAIHKVLDKYIKDKDIVAKEISFVLHGRDTIIRHIDVPFMSMDKIGETAIWEISQYLPEMGANYYIDYEILDRIATKEQKLYKVMVVATPKAKVDRYIELCKMLGLDLKTIDIAANCVARTFSNVYKKDKKMESIGVIDFGSKSSSLIILDKGKLFVEREVSFGMASIVEQISKEFGMDQDKAYDFLRTNMDFGKIDVESSIQNNIKNILDTQFDVFDKLIMFYNSGKVNKKLDYIYVIGAGCELFGIENYISNFTGTEVKLVSSINDIKIDYKALYSYDFKFFVNAYGLMLRDSAQNLNLLPDTMKKTKSYLLLLKRAKLGAVAAIIILAICAITPIVYNKTLENKISNLDEQIAQSIIIEGKNRKLLAQKSELDTYVSKVDLLTQNKVILSEKIKGLQKYIPQDVVFDSITYSDETYSISAHAKSYTSISTFVANLQMSKDYSNARIQSVSSSSTQFNFNVEIKGEK